MVIVTLELMLCYVGGSPVVRRGCHKPIGIRPFRSESSVAVFLYVTVVVYICVRIIGVFQQQLIPKYSKVIRLRALSSINTG